MEAFLDLITLNESVDYLVVVYAIAIYILMLWIVVSIWAGKDAYKRYEGNQYAAILWFLVVLLFNFPGFMFYLVVRPEEVNENSYFGGGVNIPLANFVDKNEDFVMGIQLKINNSELTEQVRDMRLTLDWESDDPKKKLNAGAITAEAKQVEKKLIDLQKLVALFNKAGEAALSSSAKTQDKTDANTQGSPKDSKNEASGYKQAEKKSSSNNSNSRKAKDRAKPKTPPTKSKKQRKPSKSGKSNKASKNNNKK